VSEATRRILREADIDARVDGLLPDGQPIPVIPPAVTAADEARVTVRPLWPKDPEREVLDALRSEKDDAA